MFTCNIVQSINFPCLIFSSKNLTSTSIKQLPTSKTNAGWRQIEPSEASGDRRLLNDGPQSVRAEQIYGGEWHPNICKTSPSNCAAVIRNVSEELGGQTTLSERSERAYTVKVGFLLSWLASNLYRLMQGNGHVFVLRLHKFLLSFDRRRLWKICCSPLFFSQHVNQTDKGKLRLFRWLNWRHTGIC